MRITVSSLHNYFKDFNVCKINVEDSSITEQFWDACDIAEKSMLYNIKVRSGVVAQCRVPALHVKHWV